MEALIASSDERVIRYLSTQLKARNIEIALATSNRAAIEIIKSRGPWLVFADIQGKGIEALPLLRAIEKERPEVSVVGLSQAYDSDEAISLLRRGVRDYISMPLEEHKEEIQKAIRRAQVRAMGIVSYMRAHDDLEAQHDTIGHELRQLQEDQEAGRYVQLKIFPKNPIQLASFEFSHRIFPSLYLSGDFIDYFPLDAQRSFFYFADVSGHGASSAFVTVMLKTISHRWVQQAKKTGELSPARFIQFVNKELLDMQLGKHMTLFCGVLDDSQKIFCYATAAHFPKPRYRSGGKMYLIEEDALPVGVFEVAEYPENSISIDDDFTLYLFSDGIMEMIDAEDLSEKERILNQEIDASEGDIEALSQSLGLQACSGLPDDIGILLVRRFELEKPSD